MQPGAFWLRRKAPAVALRVNCRRVAGIYFAAVVALTEAIHAFVRASSTSSGRAPPLSISSWKSRMSNLSPSSFFARCAQFEDLQLTDLVRQRLRRVGDVAVGFGLHLRLVLRRMRMEEVDHLLARPVLGSAHRCRARAGWRAAVRPTDDRSSSAGPGRSRPPRRDARRTAPSPRHRRCSRTAGGTAADPAATARSRSACDGPGTPSWYAVDLDVRGSCGWRSRRC